MAKKEIIDFISGKKVQGTPEEIEAVQPFAQILVDDYGYPKANIQTHPQFRVKKSPSDLQKKSYPVDIAVFSSSKHTDDNIRIIVECKKKTRKDGLSQLKNYLALSSARLGVWFNGKERLYLKKINNEDGSLDWEFIPNIPKNGQRLEDIGMFKRKDLKPTHNLKSNFKAIRNYLAANTVGATRDEILAQQIINLIFCKIYDERFTAPDDMVTFRAGLNESPQDVQARILKLFKKVKAKYDEVFADDDEISLDAKSILYVVGELQNYALTTTQRDVVADAFETFIGQALKGSQGQFFTPRNVVKMMVECVDPSTSDKIIDPSCGTGGFLVEALRYVWHKQEKQAYDLGWERPALDEEKYSYAIKNICGIDKDSFLAKVTKAYMALLGDGKSGIFCEDSLDQMDNWGDNTKTRIGKGQFSILLANPPFGSKIPVSGEDKLKQYDLAYKWKLDKKTGIWDDQDNTVLKPKEAPQILFIERDYQLLMNKGIMAIVLPDGVFGNEGFGYVRQWLEKHGRILAVIDLPVETFEPNTATKTSVLIFQKLKPKDIPEDYEIFMAIAETCGHDRRGNAIKDDDISKISKEYRNWVSKQNISKVDR